MTKRRGKIDDLISRELIEETGQLQPRGNDFDYCVSLFKDDMELKNLSYHNNALA